MSRATAVRSGLCMFHRGDASGRPRRGKVFRLLGLERVGQIRGFLGRIRHFGREFSAQLYVLDIGGIGVRVLSGVSEVECCDQTLGVNRVGQSLKQLERAQSTAEQLQPLSIGREDAQYGGPLLGDLAEQLEPGTVLEPLRGHDDLKWVRAQQIQAIAFVRDAVDAVQLPERSSDRQVTGRILVDNEHTHAGKLPGRPRFGLSGTSRFPYSGGIHSVLLRTQVLGRRTAQWTRRAWVTFGTLLNLRSTRASCSRSVTDTVTRT